MKLVSITMSVAIAMILGAFIVAGIILYSAWPYVLALVVAIVAFRHHRSNASRNVTNH